MYYDAAILVTLTIADGALFDSEMLPDVQKQEISQAETNTFYGIECCLLATLIFENVPRCIL